MDFCETARGRGRISGLLQGAAREHSLTASVTGEQYRSPKSGAKRRVRVSSGHGDARNSRPAIEAHFDPGPSRDSLLLYI